MILLLLRDGNFAEVPGGSDVIRRDHSLLCINGLGETLAAFNAAEIVAYTCSEAAARRLTEQGDELEGPTTANAEFAATPGQGGRNGNKDHRDF
jgi:hypothetical protein